MSWDPEIDDPADLRRQRSGESPGDVGRDVLRDLTDEPPPAWRTAAPDPLAPIDENAPVSGHVPFRAAPPVTTAVGHDWATARPLIQPVLRPVDTAGMPLDEATPDGLAAHGTKSHTQPLVDEGPEGLVLVYALPSEGFDVIVNGDHVLSWGVDANEIRAAALANLAAWSAGAAWTTEEDGPRRLVSSATGDGWDASRILLPEARRHLAESLGRGGARVLVGLPERHLLVAGALAPTDAEFAGLFAEFVREASGDADEPIDRRVFELVGERLVVFAG